MKINKREIKYQRELLNKIQTGTTFTDEFIDMIYGGDEDHEGLNPAMLDNLSEGGVYWTPYYLAQDFAVMGQGHGHILDLCGGIGMLSFRMLQMDTYRHDIESITIVEYNPAFVELGKKIMPSAKWVCANAYSKDLLDDLVKDLPDKRFDLVISNPPFGVDQSKGDYSWLNYQGHRDLMAVEIALRYGKQGHFILPTGSVPFEFSTVRARQYGYIEDPERWSQRLKKFIKENKDIQFTMSCNSIDTSVFQNDWKNLPGGIGCEVVNVCINPWSLCDGNDTIHNTVSRKGYSL